MQKYGLRGMLIGLVALSWGSISSADDLTIYNVQYTTDPSGESPYYNQFHNVTGGVVTHIREGSWPRIYLQDPEQMDGWGAIYVLDVEHELGGIQVGDWVNFTDLHVNEKRGTTYLDYEATAFNPSLGFEIVSHDNPVPEPITLTAADLPIHPAPDNHLLTEPYESMLATLEDLTVGALGFGKADDNYELWQGDEVAWGTDYFTAPSYDPFYHPAIQPGAFLESITGIVEQYTKDPDQPDGWDYYQLCTRGAYDIVPEPSTVALVLGGLVLAGRRRRSMQRPASPTSGLRTTDSGPLGNLS